MRITKRASKTRKFEAFLLMFVLVIWAIGYGYYSFLNLFYKKQLIENQAEAKRVYESIPIWHKKIKTEQITKIGIITDTHVRPTRIDRSDKSEDAPRQLKGDDLDTLRNFTKQMIIFKPDFIVHLGDVIEGGGDNYSTASQGVRLVKNELEKAGVPDYWVVGNHDLRALTKEQFMKILDLDALDKSFDVGDYRFVIVDANYNLENLPRTPGANSFIPGNIPPQTMAWLEEQLKTDKRVFIFIHQGTFLDASPGDPRSAKKNDEDEEGNEKNEIGGTGYFMKASIRNAAELNNLLAEYRVSAIFNGHMEARRYEQIGTTKHYSLTGTEKSELYPESYYELTISGGNPDMEMFYIPDGEKAIREVDFESGEK